MLTQYTLIWSNLHIIYGIVSQVGNTMWLMGITTKTKTWRGHQEFKWERCWYLGLFGVDYISMCCASVCFVPHWESLIVFWLVILGYSADVISDFLESWCLHTCGTYILGKEHFIIPSHKINFWKDHCAWLTNHSVI